MALACPPLRPSPKISPQWMRNWSSDSWFDGSTHTAKVRISWRTRVNISGGRSCVWSLFPRRYIYSSDMTDVDPIQLSELWVKTLKVRRDPVKILKSLEHSFVFVVVLAREEEVKGTQTKIVGVGRLISDGAFIATVCDVAVDPAYQRRGIGRKIVKYLVKATEKMDGPSGFAAFPPPLARRFFWMIGFRYDKKFHFMVYQGKLLDNRDANSVDSDTKHSKCILYDRANEALDQIQRKIETLHKRRKDGFNARKRYDEEHTLQKARQYRFNSGVHSSI